MEHELVSRLRSAMLKELPGEEAQFRMAPFHRVRQVPPDLDKYRPSAVMILFCREKQGGLFIPLIERMSYNGAHSAQISLPGGKYEPGDGELSNTALRECYEEIGIDQIELLGKLTALHIPVSNFTVHPFIGYCKITDPVFVPHEREVKSILKMRPDTLQDDLTVERGEIRLNNNLKISAPWFNIEGHRVWGATAMILSELKEMIGTIS